jgi:hypothetical protein
LVLERWVLNRILQRAVEMHMGIDHQHTRLVLVRQGWRRVAEEQKARWRGGGGGRPPVAFLSKIIYIANDHPARGARAVRR